MRIGDVLIEVGDTFTLSISNMQRTLGEHQMRAPDGEESLEESNAFDEFCEGTVPIPVSTDPHNFGVWFPISVLSHHGNWISGRAAQYRMVACSSLGPSAPCRNPRSNHYTLYMVIVSALGERV